MAKNDSKHIPNVDLSEYLFAEIASSAAEINEFCSHIDFESDAETLEVQIRVMRKLVARMGWMADLGCKKLTGGESVMGDAEQWLMFPAYTRLLERTKQTPV
jgi:hypothetical protein